jgi:hypothetical protein
MQTITFSPRGRPRVRSTSCTSSSRRSLRTRGRVTQLSRLGHGCGARSRCPRPARRVVRRWGRPGLRRHGRTAPAWVVRQQGEPCVRPYHTLCTTLAWVVYEQGAASGAPTGLGGVARRWVVREPGGHMGPPLVCLPSMNVAPTCCGVAQLVSQMLFRLRTSAGLSDAQPALQERKHLTKSGCVYESNLASSDRQEAISYQRGCISRA